MRLPGVFRITVISKGHGFEETKSSKKSSLKRSRVRGTVGTHKKISLLIKSYPPLLVSEQFRLTN